VAGYRRIFMSMPRGIYGFNDVKSVARIFHHLRMWQDLS
jgi:hypothetical protein